MYITTSTIISLLSLEKVETRLNVCRDMLVIPYVKMIGLVGKNDIPWHQTYSTDVPTDQNILALALNFVTKNSKL